MRRKLFGEIASNGGQKMRRSLFSDSAITYSRRKLFSNEGVCYSKNYSYESIDDTLNNIKNQKRRSLFSNSDEGIQTCVHTYECTDCGHVFEAEGETPAGLRCPNCGGNRVVKRDNCTCCNESCDDPETCDATDEALKEFSGTSDTYDNMQKQFSDRGLDIEEVIASGDARYNSENDTVCFSENADAVRKLFSRLVISVTKELELDPVDSKEALIQRLSDSPTMTPRAIIMIKKAHGIQPMTETYHDDESDNEDYIKDSGLENDLKLEHGGHDMSISELSNILKTQYNDAPDDILDKLVKSGIIDINGSEVTVNK